MNARRTILVVSRVRHIDEEVYLNGHALKEREIMKHPTRHMLLAMTFAVVVAVTGLLYPTPAGASEVIDQAQTEPWTEFFYIGQGYQPQMAQIVTAGMYGTLHRVSLYLGNISATGPVTVSIETVIGGVPSGNQIASRRIPVSALPPYDQPGWVDIVFNGVLVAPGTQYAVVLFTDGVIQWYSSGDVYSRGYMLVNRGYGWNSLSASDAMFQTYVIPDTLDQWQHVSAGAKFLKGDGNPVGQTFTAGLSGVLDRVAVYLTNTYNPATGPLEVSIQTLAGWFPSGTEIGHGSIPSSSIPPYPDGGWVTIGISGAVVTAGTPYALVLTEGQGRFYWFYDAQDIYQGGAMMDGYAGNWYFALGDAVFETYVATPIAFAPPPPPPQTITPCSGGVCPAVTGNVTPTDSTSRVTSNVQFRERPDGTVHGILNFNDSRTGDLALKGCVTGSAACRLTVTTFACTNQHSITVAGTYTPKGGTADYYRLTLSGVRDGIGTFTLTVGDNTYTVAHYGIVDVTCP